MTPGPPRCVGTTSSCGETRSRRTGDTIGRERLLENDALVCYDRELVRGTILAAKPGAAGG